jgi:hypothetical protein
VIRVAARFVLLATVFATLGLGVVGSWGRGPGLVFGSLLVAIYVERRGRRVPTLGFALLTIGLIGAAGLWLWAGFAFLS